MIKIRESRSVLSDIKNEIQNVIHNKMVSYGFEDNEADDYYVVSVSKKRSEITVEVRADLSYDSMMDLKDLCDPIVEKYDKNSYFDMVDSGIMEAIINCR